ncbi:hypothetical protein MBM_01671 [Drepanopeziza brunnea f. sp. 'multigermtubi' MB_m1]|uniref:Uncharacterized protein n=2 Tax=Drepanopeziza brunnea f. sp. 'multigermtubi' TaxID=698441 RepID=K1Y3I6_MARBU|nr:uncharacterized protein MBM_01671 [Drepanopeziza brunnea f. sp. 'multigermtubi' MB_m1]EKD19719.1 hypothetical protein MBM_01671 [Drepanopeziza brunnea f. sp. 'multigermtubi' MB_m1]
MIFACCMPRREKSVSGSGSTDPVYHQPRLISLPIPEPQEGPSTRGREWAARTNFSMKRKPRAFNGPSQHGPPIISHPSDFRLLENPTTRRAPGDERYRPLELSIYMPENQLSPILPLFGNNSGVSMPPRYSKELPLPPAAVTLSRRESSMSFRIPRKPVSGTSSDWTVDFKPRPGSLSAEELLAALENELPKAPPPARLRANTEPPVYERLKSALHERCELERRLKNIEDTIENKKSAYFNSRSTSRASSRPASIYSEFQEPMPAPTLLEPFDPSPMPVLFSQPVSSQPGQRPRTVPSKIVHIPSRLAPFTEASATSTTPYPSLIVTSQPAPRPSSCPTSRPNEPLPPPLPLILQQPQYPIRTKKSFSRVSNWLFPASDGHNRNISLDSITNVPKPVTSREGFYQCINLGPTMHARRNSDSTVSTLESDVDEPSIPTTWSPDSSPRSNYKQRNVAIRTLSVDSDRNEKSIEMTRVRTFGEAEMGADERWRMGAVSGHTPRMSSVGLAF